MIHKQMCMNGAQALVQMLKEYQVEVIFGGAG